jgi:SpoVK/Ycf46/Vps4 family AAA+-type ATPase
MKWKSANGEDFIPYKLRHVKCFASNEWMADSTKKYRTVYDKAELSYLRVEFSIFNKWFDEHNWDCKITLKLFENGAERKELCSLESEVSISKEQDRCTIYDGWGTPNQGTFFNQGSYTWEVFIEDVFIGSETVFVNDVGLTSDYFSPYLEPVSINFYEGSAEEDLQITPIFKVQFNRDSARYIWTQFKFNVLPNESFHYEFIFNYFDNANQLKGQVRRVEKMEAGKSSIEFNVDAGWGNENKLSWQDEEYRVDVLFMDVCIASALFNVGNEDILGSSTMFLGTIPTTVLTPLPEATFKEELKTESLETLLAKLEKLVGLEKVKKEVKETINYVEFSKMRQKEGFKDTEKINLHSVFLGNPGTGKTTVARMLGKIYHAMGVLSKGHVLEVDRSVLIGEYIGQTAPKVKKAIDDARGGVLFIDEAYALTPEAGDERDFGREAIEIILKEMSDGPGDIAIFCAGYPDKMKHFLDFNPGMKSRFNQYFQFDDYVPDDLMTITHNACTEQELIINIDSTVYLKEKITRMFRDRDRSFGNARLINNILGSAKMNLADRIMRTKKVEDITREDLQLLTIEDFKEVFLEEQKKEYGFKIDELLLSESISELNQLVGMVSVKEHINKMIKLIRFYNETGKDVLNKFSLHTVFTGNPGTGKTTVARILARIYNSLGLIEKGHCVEVDKSGLIGKFIGETADKTKQVIASADGGVLFIDEAYALNDGQNGYGREAIEVILKKMEDNRGKFAVFAAGYTNNMKQFLDMNPGLMSRFNQTLHFEDYNETDLLQIGKMQLKLEELNLDAEAEAHLCSYFKYLYEHRDAHFGNARMVRSAVESIISNQHIRLADIKTNERSQDMIETVTLADLHHLKNEMVPSSSGRRMIGFNN